MGECFAICSLDGTGTGTGAAGGDTDGGWGWPVRATEGKLTPARMAEGDMGTGDGREGGFWAAATGWARYTSLTSFFISSSDLLSMRM